jgi:uncharacterized DUF497 family protein
MHKCAYTGPVGCEWDPAKAQANFKKHGIRFSDAATVLSDERALTIRDPFSASEERWITVGLDALGRVLLVVYAWRAENARLISARKATPREREQYKEQNET